MTALERKKAEVEKLIDEFSRHTSRVHEIGHEIDELYESIRTEYGAPVVEMLKRVHGERLCRIVAGSERPKTLSIRLLLTH